MFKSFFITLSPVWLVFVLFKSYQLAFDQQWLTAIGLFLAAVPMVLFLAFILGFRNLARTKKNLYLMQFCSLFGVLLCAGLMWLEDHKQFQTVVYATISYAITILYIYWYSKNNRVINQQLKPGHTLPDFSITDTYGNTIKAAELRTKSTIFMFTRGNWCPLCMAQINEVITAYKELELLGVQVAIIASQPEKNTQSLASRFDVPFLFLVDKEQKLGQQLGIIHHNGLPLGFQAFGYQNDQYYPTVIATNEKGLIIYSDQTSNYRVRPEPEDLIKLYR